MPLFIAAFVLGGSFFGYMGHDVAHEEIQSAYQVQEHWLDLRDAATDQVEDETFHDDYPAGIEGDQG